MYVLYVIYALCICQNLYAIYALYISVHGGLESEVEVGIVHRAV